MKRRKDGRFQKCMAYDRPDGTKYQKYFYAYSEADLFRQISSYEAEKEAGPLFRAIAENWKEEHYENIEYNTARGYEKSYKRAVARFGDMYIKEITPAMVKTYLEYFKRQGYALKTVTSHLSVLNLILLKALVDGDLDSNPAEHVKMPTGLKKTKRKPPAKSEIEIIKNSLDKPWGLWAYFILYTGLRKSEALALQYSDIDFERKEISITKAWYTKNNKAYIKKPKTEKGERSVPLLAPLERVLVPGPLNDYIFGFPTEKEYRVHWDAYRASTGITCGVHQIRHEFCTFLYDAGLNEFDAMNIMGHADISTMRNIYTHIREGRVAHITKKLNQALENPD